MYRRGDFITPQTNKQKPRAGGGEAPSLNPFLGACHTEAQLSLSLQGRWSPASRGCWGCLLNGCVLRPCSLWQNLGPSGTEPAAGCSVLLQPFPPPLLALDFLPLELNLKTCASLYMQDQTRS